MRSAAAGGGLPPSALSKKNGGHLPCQPRFVARRSATAAAWLSRIPYAREAMRLGWVERWKLGVGALQLSVPGSI